MIDQKTFDLYVSVSRDILEFAIKYYLKGREEIIMETVKDDTYYESRIREELHKLHKLETKLAKRLLVVSSEEEGEVTLDYLLNVSSYVKDVFIDTEDELVEILGSIDDLAEEMVDDLFVSPER